MTNIVSALNVGSRVTIGATVINQREIANVDLDDAEVLEDVSRYHDQLLLYGIGGTGVGFDPSLPYTWTDEQTYDNTAIRLKGESAQGNALEGLFLHDDADTIVGHLYVRDDTNQPQWDGQIRFGDIVQFASEIRTNSAIWFGAGFEQDLGLSPDFGGNRIVTTAGVGFLAAGLLEAMAGIFVADGFNVAWSDIALSRFAPGGIDVSGYLQVTGGLNVLGDIAYSRNGFAAQVPANPTDLLLSGRVQTEGFDRIIESVSGMRLYGDGSAAGDTTTERTGGPGAGVYRITAPVAVVLDTATVDITGDVSVSGNTLLGDNPADTIGLHGNAGVAQSAAIPDAAGGATIDAEARAAVNALLAYLRTRGDVAV